MLATIPTGLGGDEIVDTHADCPTAPSDVSLQLFAKHFAPEAGEKNATKHSHSDKISPVQDTRYRFTRYQKMVLHALYESLPAKDRIGDVVKG